MGKVIRPRYPVEFSIGFILLIFVLAFLLSSQIFRASWHQLIDGTAAYELFGMFLVSVAVIIMVLILWEEFLFPVRIKPVADGVLFRNHGRKLKMQLLIYLLIPAIFAFVYLDFEVRLIRFSIWAGICIIMPVVARLGSGIKNYNDFLRLTNHEIEYRNNQEAGTYKVQDIRKIVAIRDEKKVLHKIQLLTSDNKEVMIDLDEMELDSFLGSIDKFLTFRYKSLL